MPSSSANITALLSQLGNPATGDQRAVFDQLVPLLYGELKLLAKSNRYRWQGSENLGTTSLVHEAYSKLAHRPGDNFDNRKQFYALASRTMRTILIDNARHHERQKRGGGQQPVRPPEDLFVSSQRSHELVALDDALNDLEHHEPELARIVEYRCFGGLSVVETAEALDISPATVKRRWALARAWLYRQLSPIPNASA